MLHVLKRSYRESEQLLETSFENSIILQELLFSSFFHYQGPPNSRTCLSGFK